MNNQNLPIRKCKQCNSNMYVKVQNQEKELHPLDDKENIFVCESCGHEVNIATNSSTLRNFITGIFTFGFLIYFLITGLFDFILYSFTQSFFSTLLGIGLILVVLFFAAGCYIVLKNGIIQIKMKKSYHLVDSEEYLKQNNKQIYLALFLGALPLLFAIGIGYIDFYLYEINETMAFIFIPIVFSPIIFAKKLNSSIIGVFYGTIFWAILGGGGFYLFG